MAERILLFGGTFDPVHSAHLAIAREMAAAARCDGVLLIPTGANPLKTPPVASGADRLAMLRAAVADDPLSEISDVEVFREPPCYTFDTVAALQAGRPEAEFVLAMGADSVRELPHWHRAEELIARVELAVACRPPTDAAALGRDIRRMKGLSPELLEKVASSVVRTSLIDVSSTEVRRRLREGQSVEGLVPVSVAEYVERTGLYR